MLHGFVGIVNSINIYSRVSRQTVYYIDSLTSLTQLSSSSAVLLDTVFTVTLNIKKDATGREITFDLKFFI